MNILYANIEVQIDTSKSHFVWRKWVKKAGLMAAKILPFCTYCLTLIHLVENRILKLNLVNHAWESASLDLQLGCGQGPLQCDPASTTTQLKIAGYCQNIGCVILYRVCLVDQIQFQS